MINITKIYPKRSIKRGSIGGLKSRKSAQARVYTHWLGIRFMGSSILHG